MSTISIIPENNQAGEIIWRAVADKKEATGKTVGEAIDAITPLLEDEESSSMIVVQRMRPDKFFTAEQQKRLTDLMSKWRTARDSGSKLSADEQYELEALIDAQLEGSAKRAEALLASKINTDKSAS